MVIPSTDLMIVSHAKLHSMTGSSRAQSSELVRNLCIPEVGNHFLISISDQETRVDVCFPSLEVCPPAPHRCHAGTKELWVLLFLLVLALDTDHLAGEVRSAVVVSPCFYRREASWSYRPHLWSHCGVTVHDVGAAAAVGGRNELGVQLLRIRGIVVCVPSSTPAAAALVVTHPVVAPRLVYVGVARQFLERFAALCGLKLPVQDQRGAIFHQNHLTSHVDACVYGLRANAGLNRRQTNPCCYTDCSYESEKTSLDLILLERIIVQTYKKEDDKCWMYSL